MYALLAVLSLAAFIWTENAAALFLCVCLFALPVITFIMLLIARKSVRFACDVQRTCMRGSALELTMQVGVRPRFLVGSVEVCIEIENTTFHKTVRGRFDFTDLTFTPMSYKYFSDDSGRMHVKVVGLRLIGIAGICSLYIKRNDTFEAIVAPVLHDDLQVTIAGGNVSRSYGDAVDTSRKGSDRSEIFSVRDYTAGDAMSSVHWKLSSKFDSLKSKEYGSTNDYRTLILVDLSRKKYYRTATDVELNVILDIAISLSNAFKSEGRQHCVGWVTDGIFNCCEVWDDETFLQMINNLMSAKVCEESSRSVFYLASSKDAERFSKYILVTSAANSAELRELGGEISAIAIGEELGEHVVGNVRVLGASADNACAVLQMSEL